ncbi:MAG: hypothetical protein GF372_02365 [Candidatus Marinimicrobia bacterium]|nr:hypothetical protein [Candidatus Neomarinimicrobiota bacterium]
MLKKVFTAIREAADWADRLEGKGIDSSGLEINWQDMIYSYPTSSSDINYMV